MPWFALAGAVFAVFVLSKELRTRTAQCKAAQYEAAQWQFQAESFRVSDSLNAARAEALTMEAEQYAKLREADRKTIEELKGRGRTLAAAAKVATQTQVQVVTQVRDSVVTICDTMMTAALCFDHSDRFLTLEGCVYDNKFEGSVTVRDSLHIVETVKYKRFLFWKTRKVKSRDLRVVSSNPHTLITGVEYIRIEK